MSHIFLCFLSSTFQSQFHQHVYAKILRAQIQKSKKIVKSSVYFCAFGIWACKSCSSNVDEIDPDDNDCYISHSFQSKQANEIKGRRMPKKSSYHPLNLNEGILLSLTSCQYQVKARFSRTHTYTRTRSAINSVRRLIGSLWANPKVITITKLFN